jgi:hypothetical protein
MIKLLPTAAVYKGTPEKIRRYCQVRCTTMQDGPAWHSTTVHTADIRIRLHKDPLEKTPSVQPKKMTDGM